MPLSKEVSKMIEQLLKEENCRVVQGVKDWKEAIHLSLEPLVAQGYCTDQYEQAVLDNTYNHQGISGYMLCYISEYDSHPREVSIRECTVCEVQCTHNWHTDSW